MLPARLPMLLGLTRKIILLAPMGDDFIVQRILGAQATAMGLLSQAGMNDQVARDRANGAECVLRIPSDQGLRREAAIAVSALPRGFDAVAGEIERQTPFALDQVYLGYRVEEAVDARGRVIAHLALAPCSGVDKVLQTLACAEIVPDRISLADASGVNLIGDTVHILMNRGRDAPPKFILACVFGLLLAALASPHVQNAVALSRVQHALLQARETARLMTEIDNGAGDPQTQMAWLAARRSQRPSVTGLLNAISAALPDTAYLAQFELAGGTLVLQGVAASASDLIAPLEQLPQVEKVAFSAPTLRDPVSGLEQFQLSLSFSGIPLADTAE